MVKGSSKKTFQGDTFRNNSINGKPIMKRAPIQPKFTIFWESKDVYEMLSFALFGFIFKDLKSISYQLYPLN